MSKKFTSKFFLAKFSQNLTKIFYLYLASITTCRLAFSLFCRKSTKFLRVFSSPIGIVMPDAVMVIAIQINIASGPKNNEEYPITYADTHPNSLAYSVEFEHAIIRDLFNILSRTNRDKKG